MYYWLFRILDLSLLEETWQGIDLNLNLNSVINRLFFMQRDLNLNSSHLITLALERSGDVCDVVLSAELVSNISIDCIV